MKTYTVACEVTYRRTWHGIQAESAEEAQERVFWDGCDIAHDEDLVDGPSYASDMEVTEEPDPKCSAQSNIGPGKEGEL